MPASGGPSRGEAPPRSEAAMAVKTHLQPANKQVLSKLVRQRLAPEGRHGRRVGHLLSEGGWRRWGDVSRSGGTARRRRRELGGVGKASAGRGCNELTIGISADRPKQLCFWMMLQRSAGEINAREG